MSLQDFLAQQTSEGKLESGGTFTLGLGEARSKLQRFRLPAPDYYLLKLVQAADSVGSEQIRFTFERSETMVTFTTEQPNRLVESQTILSGLSEPMALSDGPLRHLVLALGGALAFEPKELVWLIRKDRAGLMIRITKDEVITEELNYELPIKEGQTRCTCYLNHADGWKFWKGAGRRAEAIRLLSDRCRLARLEVIADHRLIDQPFASSGGLNHRLFESYRLDPEGSISCRSPYKSSFTLDEGGLNFWKPTYWTKFTYYDPTPNCCLFFEALDPEEGRLPVTKLPDRILCRHAYGVMYNNAAHSLVFPVKNSVVLNSSQEELHMYGLIAYVPADGMRLDLTDFQVIHDEVYQAALDQVNEDTQHIPELVKEHQHLKKPFRLYA